MSNFEKLIESAPIKKVFSCEDFIFPPEDGCNVFYSLGIESTNATFSLIRVSDHELLWFRYSYTDQNYPTATLKNKRSIYSESKYTNGRYCFPFEEGDL